MLIDIEREATLARLRDLKPAVVLAVQDTSSFNFAHHPATKGLGVLEDDRTAGFFAHSTLAVSDEGVPLGLFDQQVWRRDPGKRKARNAHQDVPITEKESMKWLNALYETEDSPVQVISIADREGDIYELFQEVHNRQSDCIIRAIRDRRLATKDKLYAALEACPIVATYEFEVARQHNQEKRVAEVAIRYTSVTILPPKNRKKAIEVIPLSPLTVQVVEVIEQDVPDGLEAIHWILITTLPVDCLEDALRVLRFYTYRWLVERFHYVLKSGCRFEDSQLQSYATLSRFLALCSHQAWQILELTYQARVTPDAPCDKLLTVEQWQALQAQRTGNPLAVATCPSLEEACRWIAQLGGFIGRKSDGQPGVKVLWRGWQRLQDLASMWVIFNPPPNNAHGGTLFGIEPLGPPNDTSSLDAKIGLKGIKRSQKIALEKVSPEQPNDVGNV